MHGTRSIFHFEALEQTLRLRLVSGPVDKKVFLSRNSLSRTVRVATSTKFSTVYLTGTELAHHARAVVGRGIS